MSEDNLTPPYPLPLSETVSLLATHPCGLVALDKPVDVRSHPNRASGKGERKPSLLNETAYDFEKEAYHWEADGQERWLYLINRLDSPTSGVILACTNAELAEQVKGVFLRNKAQKVYHAIVIGKPGEASKLWEDFLKRKKKSDGLRVEVDPGGTLARTRMAFVKADQNKQGLSLLKLLPRTGKTHQLRVQCAQHGLPILGDSTYGSFSRNRAFRKVTGLGRMFLHSTETELQLRWEGEDILFKARSPLPPEFDQVLLFNRELQIESPLRGGKSSSQKSDLEKIRKKLRTGKKEWKRPPPPDLSKQYP